jgi:DNA mismatch endonuclease (patch repair protein)
MIDIVSKSKRSQMMASVNHKNTKPEIKVRTFLHKSGYRFRLHRKDLPGNPDIVLPRFRHVIFVHGCFWHQHTGCRKAKRPASNATFWDEKLDRNMQRDRDNFNALLVDGWSVSIVWECEIDDRRLEHLLREIAGK